MKKQELLQKLDQYPEDAEIIPRHNSYLHRSWLIIKTKNKTDYIIF